MDLQAAFNDGFDAVKRYVDDITDQVEERLIAVEKRQPDSGDISDTSVIIDQTGRRRSISAYPVHLSPDERIAVFEKAERDLHAQLLVKREHGSKNAHLDIVMRIAATLLVREAWLEDRISALETTVAASSPTKSKSSPASKSSTSLQRVKC